MEHKSYRKPAVSGENAGSNGAARRMYASQTSPGTRYGSRTSAQTGNGGRASQPSRSNSISTQRSRGGSAPRRPMPRRRKLSPTAILVLILVSIGALVGIVKVGSAWFISAINAKTYCSNIYVNGVEVNSFTKEGGMQYMRELVDAQLSTPYELSWEGNSWSFTALDFGSTIDIETMMERAWNIGHVGNIFDRSASIRALKENPIYLTAQLKYDEAALNSYLDGIYNQLYIAPQDAVLMADLSNPYVASEAADGQELDVDAARHQMLTLFEKGEGGSVLPVTALSPALSTEEAMGSLNLIIEYKTDVTARGYNGRFNVRKALSYFYGMIVQPGEEIDFNEVVGQRTEERGWQPGTEYIGGGQTAEGFGGGVCQASTTLYGALLQAGMTIIDRSPHSMTVAYVDPSLDAAVTNSGNKNLVFRNDTENPIIIYTEVTKEYAMVQIYGARPKYRYELESNIVEKKSKASRNGFIDDVDGLFCTYTDQFKLYKEGIPECASEGWLVAYDWDTNEEISRTQLSYDQYSSGYNIYWRGVNTRDGGVIGDGSLDAGGF